MAFVQGETRGIAFGLRMRVSVLTVGKRNLCMQMATLRIWSRCAIFMRPHQNLRQKSLFKVVPNGATPTLRNASRSPIVDTYVEESLLQLGHRRLHFWRLVLL